ncbi:hypothetical protein [Saliterribacillus persicus]|uniref:Membrane protein YqhR n=1 Tax=Saliterribacillus persicus TaxID=930114 RepID=A0A368XQA3_9BACI|nr:hypothetical protein [Saliterribacillus persicus]RCW69719.1 hypothetical protein DFR57_107107 [Saliterribacillus persicus]
MHIFIKGVWLGTISGFVLGFFLWSIEELFHLKVYTLLLNVDFIPLLSDINLTIVGEWFLHLIISWAISLVFLLFLTKKSRTNRQVYIVAGLLCGGAALSYFPLTFLANKETPALFDGFAIVTWMIGHVIYGLILIIYALKGKR